MFKNRTKRLWSFICTLVAWIAAPLLQFAQEGQITYWYLYLILGLFPFSYFIYTLITGKD